MATNALFDIFGDPKLHAIGLSVLSQVKNKGTKFIEKCPYLGKDYDLKSVKAVTEEGTIWGDSAGLLFEANQKAEIDGCYPGNFSTIDSIESDEKLNIKIGVSLKVMFNPDADTTGSKLSSYMSDLKFFAYDKRTLRLKTGGTKEVTVWAKDLDILVLRIGVPAKYFIANKAALDQAALKYTSTQLQGYSAMAVNQVCVRKHNKEIPIKVEFVSAPDDFFKAGQGELYEELKDAEIHGKRPGSFLTIDKLKKDKARIVSYKARDILKNYQGPDGFKRLANQLKADIDDLAVFKSYHESCQGGRKVDQDSYKEKRLSWAVPVLTLEQLGAFHDLFMCGFSYAAHKNVMFRIHLVV